MYRRYYRYNDPIPGQKRPAPTPPPPPQTVKQTFSVQKLFSGMETDDVLLAGLLLLVLLGEDKENIDLPLVLALLYLLLQK